MTAVHVVVATDGSQQSLRAARAFKSFTDPTKITSVTVVAVVRPLAAVAFADELSGSGRGPAGIEDGSSRAAAAGATGVIAQEFAGWGPAVKQTIRSGSPATEIIKVATRLEAGLVVVASGGRGISETVLLGSTAQRVQQYAPCPVLVVRPRKRKKR